MRVRNDFPKMVDTAPYSSVFNAFVNAAESYSEAPFLRAPAISTKSYAPGEIAYSYGEVQAQVDQLVASYGELGLQVGDRVALAFDSRLDVYLHLLALNALGVSIVPLNSASSDAELLYVIEHSDSRLVVTATDFRERLDTLVDKLESCDIIGEAEFESGNKPAPCVQTDPSTEAALLYTSGTTGAPKGCMLSNEYFLCVGTWYNGLGGTCTLEQSDRLLTPLPPNHMNALCAWQ